MRMIEIRKADLIQKIDWIRSSYLYIIRISRLIVCKKSEYILTHYTQQNTIFLFKLILTTQMRCQNLTIRQCQL